MSSWTEIKYGSRKLYFARWHNQQLEVRFYDKESVTDHPLADLIGLIFIIPIFYFGFLLFRDIILDRVVSAGMIILLIISLSFVSLILGRYRTVNTLKKDPDFSRVIKPGKDGLYPQLGILYIYRPPINRSKKLVKNVLQGEIKIRSVDSLSDAKDRYYTFIIPVYIDTDQIVHLLKPLDDVYQKIVRTREYAVRTRAYASYGRYIKSQSNFLDKLINISNNQLTKVSIQISDDFPVLLIPGFKEGVFGRPIIIEKYT